MAQSHCHLLGLASDGVYLALVCYQQDGELLPRRFILTCHKGQAVYFLWHSPSSHLGRPLAVILFLRSPDFPLNPLKGSAIVQPSDAFFIRHKKQKVNPF